MTSGNCRCSHAQFWAQKTNKEVCLFQLRVYSTKKRRNDLMQNTLDDFAVFLHIPMMADNHTPIGLKVLRKSTDHHLSPKAVFVPFHLLDISKRPQGPQRTGNNIHISYRKKQPEQAQEYFSLDLLLGYMNKIADK